MSLAEKIYEEVKKLPEAKQAEIINYIIEKCVGECISNI
jgi:hypothetical protein